MSLEEKTTKSLLQSKNLEIDVKKKTEDLKKIKQIHSNLNFDKTLSIINLNNLNTEIDHAMNLKKKPLKPVDHANLLNNKIHYDKLKENKPIIKKFYDGSKQNSNPEILKMKNIENLNNINSQNLSNRNINIIQSNTNKEIENIGMNKIIFKQKISNDSIDNISFKTTQSNQNEMFVNEYHSNDNPLMNLTDQNFNKFNETNKSKWKDVIERLDDSEFRKTQIKKEKLEINSDATKIIGKKLGNSNMIYKNSSIAGKNDEDKLLSYKKVNSMIFIDDKEPIIEKRYIHNPNLQSNLNRNEQIEIEKITGFLESINLEKLLDKFIIYGYNNYNKMLFDVTDEKLKEMGILYGHKLKILKRIKELKGNLPEEKQEIKNLNKLDVAIPKSNIKYDELPDDREKFNEFIDNMSIYSKQTKLSDNNDKSRNDIQDSEEMKKRIFHQAIIDFVNVNRPKYDRDGERILYLKEEFGKEIKNQIVREDIKINDNQLFQNLSATKPTDVKIDKESFNQNYELKKIKDVIRINSAKSKKNDNIVQTEDKVTFEKEKKLNTNISFTEYADIQNDKVKAFLPINDKKETCFNCLKMFPAKKTIEYFSKKFCCALCENEFQQINMVLCSDTTCKRFFYKPYGVYELKKYYCQRECFEKSMDFRRFISENKKIENFQNKSNDINFEENIQYDPMEDF